MAVQYKAEDVAEAIRAANGIIAQAARRLGCSRDTIYRKINEYTTVEQAYEEAKESVLDLGESKLIRLVKDEDHRDHFKAVRFLLRTKGKDRGYTERQELEHAGRDGDPIQVVFESETPDADG